jgi:hypothetical protein
MVAISTRLPAAALRPQHSRLSDVEERLLECFDAAPADSSEALTPLHLAAKDYAYSLRKQGLRPEQLVVALKTLLCCHGGFQSAPSLLEQQLERVVSSSSTKYAQVLNWCLEAYYESALQT